MDNFHLGRTMCILLVKQWILSFAHNLNSYQSASQGWYLHNKIKVKCANFYIWVKLICLHIYTYYQIYILWCLNLQRGLKAKTHTWKSQSWCYVPFNSHGHIATSLLHCLGWESYPHRGSSLWLDTKLCNANNKSIMNCFHFEEFSNFYPQNLQLKWQGLMYFWSDVQWFKEASYMSICALNRIGSHPKSWPKNVKFYLSNRFITAVT